MTEKHNCAERIWRGKSPRPGRCSRDGLYLRDGKWWCGTHDPSRVAERQRAAKAKADAEMAARRKEWRVKNAAQDLLDALEELMRTSGHVENPTGREALDFPEAAKKARAAIKKAKEE